MFKIIKIECGAKLVAECVEMESHDIIYEYCAIATEYPFHFSMQIIFRTAMSIHWNCGTQSIVLCTDIITTHSISRVNNNFKCQHKIIVIWCFGSPSFSGVCEHGFCFHIVITIISICSLIQFARLHDWIRWAV